MVVRCSRKFVLWFIAAGIMAVTMPATMPALADAKRGQSLGQSFGRVLRRLDPVTAVHPALTRAVLADHNLYEGDDVQTSPDGRVSFRLDDYSEITLSGDARVKIKRATIGQRYSLTLESGAMLVDSTPTVNNQDYLVIKTGYGSVKVKEGKFWVGPLDEAMTVVNLGGAIDVVTYGGARHLADADQMIKLRDGSLPPPEPVTMRDRVKDQVMSSVTYPDRWTGEK